MLKHRPSWSACLLLAAIAAACSSSSNADSLLEPVAAAGGAAGLPWAAGSAGAPEQDGSVPDGSAQDGSVQDAPDTVPRLAQDLTVREVAVFQAVKIPIASGGAAVSSRNAPVVAGRKALVRVYVEPSGSWSPRTIAAELMLEADGATSWHTDIRQPSGSSSDGVPSSVFQIEVPAERVVEGARLSVRLTDATAAPVEEGVSSAARWPKDGTTAELGARKDGSGLQLTLVPIRYDTDGSGRLPDTSPEQLELIRGLLTALYPLVNVQLKVREPVPFDAPPSWGSVNFDELNEMLVDLKESDGAAGREYYYALVKPASSFNAYCGSSCVTGQSFVVKNANDGAYRVGAGIGFTGEDSVWTLAHEMGHMHGRGHAPCDVSASAPYPYPGGSIGVWGLDPRANSFQDPAKVTDFMGYCDLQWISDHNYRALFDRVVAISSLPASGQLLAGSWTFLRVQADGTLQWGRTLRLSSPPRGEAGEVVFLDAHGLPLQTARASVVSSSHGHGSTWLVPEAPKGTHQLEVLLPHKGRTRIATQP